jgi:hypothetical protein
LPQAESSASNVAKSNARRVARAFGERRSGID